MVTSKTEEAILYEAIAQGMQEEGWRVYHDKSQVTAEGRVCHRLLCAHKDSAIVISITRAGGTFVRIMNGAGRTVWQKPGPDLADPKFFPNMAAYLKDAVDDC